jgi:hypothetical protein
MPHSTAIAAKGLRQLIGGSGKISSERVVNENVIGSLKRFKIISDRYRNRRKRFGLRFNLIAGIHNYEIECNDKGIY